MLIWVLVSFFQALLEIEHGLRELGLTLEVGRVLGRLRGAWGRYSSSRPDQVGGGS